MQHRQLFISLSATIASGYRCLLFHSRYTEGCRRCSACGRWSLVTCCTPTQAVIRSRHLGGIESVNRFTKSTRAGHDTSATCAASAHCSEHFCILTILFAVRIDQRQWGCLRVSSAGVGTLTAVSRRAINRTASAATKHPRPPPHRRSGSFNLESTSRHLHLGPRQ